MAQKMFNGPNKESARAPPQFPFGSTEMTRRWLRGTPTESGVCVVDEDLKRGSSSGLACGTFASVAKVVVSSHEVDRAGGSRRGDPQH